MIHEEKEVVVEVVGSWHRKEAHYPCALAMHVPTVPSIRGSDQNQCPPLRGRRPPPPYWRFLAADGYRGCFERETGLNSTWEIGQS